MPLGASSRAVAAPEILLKYTHITTIIVRPKRASTSKSISSCYCSSSHCFYDATPMVEKQSSRLQGAISLMLGGSTD